MFAGLAAVILIGLLVKNIVFDSLERVTARRRVWRAPTRSEVIMDWLDLSTAVLAVIAAVASLMFPLQRDQPDDPEGRERWRR